jgi:hypothetical protein
MAVGGFLLGVSTISGKSLPLNDCKILWHTINGVIERQISLKRSGQVDLRFNGPHYFNYLLFAPIWFARQLIKILGIKEASEDEFNSAALNQLLLWTFALDVRAAPVIHPPFGVSILVIGQKIKRS